MNINIKKSYLEVGSILNLLGEKYIEKIPEKVLNKFNIENKIDINLNSLSQEAINIISYFNLLYWEEDINEKKRLIELYKENERNNIEKYSSFFENQDFKPIEKNKSIVVAEKISFWDKIKIKIKKIFNK